MVIPSHSSHPPHRPTGACYQCENMRCLRILSLESSWLCRRTTKQFASENSGKQNGRSINLAWGVGLAGPDFSRFPLQSKRQGMPGLPDCQCQDGLPSFSATSTLQTAKCHFAFDDDAKNNADDRGRGCRDFTKAFKCQWWELKVTPKWQPAFIREIPDHNPNCNPLKWMISFLLFYDAVICLHQIKWLECLSRQILLHHLAFCSFRAKQAKNLGLSWWAALPWQPIPH